MYIEYYIIENLLINYIIISCTSILIKNYSIEKKKWLGAFLGTIYSIIYIYPSLEILFTLPFKLIIMTFITLISFTYKNKKELLRISLVFYLVNIFICGSTYFIIYFTGIEHIKVSFLIVCAYISCELLKYIYKDIKTLKYIKDIKKTIDINLLGKKFTCEALIDSGNLLKDPLGNNEVIIVKSKILKEVIGDGLVEYDYENMDVLKVQNIINSSYEELASRFRLIPYKHAGSNNGSIILGIKADYIEIDKNKIGNVVIGLSNFDDSEYDAILNPNILQGI
nr:sigma-E processing peptidase SpoIIGA [uncultured Romboutsia sp.]